MHDLRTIFRNSLLFCAIAADFCAFQIARADKVINYTVPSKGAVHGNVATATGQESWSVNSRKVRTTGYGAAASATASRSSYGFLGRMTVSRAFFQAWLAYEIGSIGLEWIRQQYAEKENAEFDPANLVYRQKIPVQGYKCDINYCTWQTDITECSGFQTSTQALQCGLEKANYGGNYNKEIVGSNCSSRTNCIAYYRYSEVGDVFNVQASLWGDENFATPWADYLTNNIDAGEPTLDPDPYLTAAILDKWAHIVPEMRARVSDTVDFMPEKARYTEKDVLGNVLKDYEGVLEPMEEPIANPHKTAKRPAPEIEPTPRLKTTDLLNGNEITQPTEPIKEPVSDTTTQTTPKVEVDVDLSKLEQTTASIDSKIQPFENQEVNYEADNAEVEAPEDLTAQEAETAVVGRLKVPHLEPEKLVDAAFNAAGDFIAQDILDDKTSSCPPPRTLTIIGGARVQMPFDPICDFLAMIKKIFVPVVGWIIFLMWIRRIGSS